MSAANTPGENSTPTQSSIPPSDHSPLSPTANTAVQVYVYIFVVVGASIILGSIGYAIYGIWFKKSTPSKHPGKDLENAKKDDGPQSSDNYDNEKYTPAPQRARSRQPLRKSSISSVSSIQFIPHNSERKPRDSVSSSNSDSTLTQSQEGNYDDKTEANLSGTNIGKRVSWAPSTSTVNADGTTLSVPMPTTDRPSSLSRRTSYKSDPTLSPPPRAVTWGRRSSGGRITCTCATDPVSPLDSVSLHCPVHGQF